ncbi:hypothetical protein J5N58_07075 [Rhizobium cremeum]|uniref:hypothetical protein n=1 Tax=Rhizobium cremeum TaxID=2813827 RepID=UPI000DE060E1|nr:hypothetical protein [Rhizobium cremeum]MCJ7996714.1 hypothetical protein [Rhizobium cremeum]MCJ7999438.1 hypothetical protein [Rhizobium cremeum]
MNHTGAGSGKRERLIALQHELLRLLDLATDADAGRLEFLIALAIAEADDEIGREDGAAPI